VRKQKELTTNQEQEQQREKQGGEYLDSYSVFQFAVNSPVTRDRYTKRLDKFFSFTGIERNYYRRALSILCTKGKER
jgi:hypothetical protein